MQAIAPCITGVDTTEILASEAQERKVANVISCGDGVMNCKTTARLWTWSRQERGTLP